MLKLDLLLRQNGALMRRQSIECKEIIGNRVNVRLEGAEPEVKCGVQVSLLRGRCGRLAGLFEERLRFFPQLPPERVNVCQWLSSGLLGLLNIQFRLLRVILRNCDVDDGRVYALALFGLMVEKLDEAAALLRVSPIS